MASKKWNPPPVVEQNYDHTCWAAVLQAFCAVSAGRPKLDQEAIYDQYKKLTNCDETMGRAGMIKLLGDVRWGIKAVHVAPAGFKASGEFLYQKLKAGCVVLGYYEQKIQGFHVGLAYGIDDTSVFYMNPDSETGGLLCDDLDYFTDGSHQNLIVGSRKW